MCDECGTVWCRPDEIATDRLYQPGPDDWRVCGGDLAEPGTVRDATLDDVMDAGWGAYPWKQLPDPPVPSFYLVPDYQEVLAQAREWLSSEDARNEYGGEVPESLLRKLPASTDLSLAGHVDFSELRVEEILDAEGRALRDALNRGLETRGIGPRMWNRIPPAIDRFGKSDGRIVG